jgi:two-component system phosphate regulon response regulator PhoB
VRSLAFRFDDLDSMHAALLLGSEFREVLVPSDANVFDGEWILAVFEVETGRRATAAAARATRRDDGFALVFEQRDWTRLLRFSDLMAIEVEVEFEEEEPSTIRVPLKCISAGPGLGSAQTFLEERPEQLARPVVLFVDDDSETRDVIGAMLDAVGMDVCSFGSAEDALEAIRTTQFDLVVLDWNLPGMNGLSLCQLLRKMEEMASVPVLFLTGNTSSEDMVQAFASGADDFVLKPFRAAELGARMFALLRRSKMTKGRRLSP